MPYIGDSSGNDTCNYTIHADDTPKLNLIGLLMPDHLEIDSQTVNHMPVLN